jgi:putative endonuclease
VTGFVYIMASRRNGTIYTGVAADLAQRAHEHREGLIDGFTKRYGCKTLVWYEEHYDYRDAIQHETSIKRYYRKWKLNLIESMNPEWRDLYLDLAL